MAVIRLKSDDTNGDGSSPMQMQVWPLRPLPNLPYFSDVISLYQKKRGDRLMPRWKDFSFAEFTGWHTRLAVSEREGDDFRFRLFGSVFVELFATDLTGKLLAQSLSPEQAPRTKAHFKQLVEGPFIGLGTGHVPMKNRDFIRFEVLDLPLVDDSGNLSHFLHATVKTSDFK